MRIDDYLDNFKESLIRELESKQLTKESLTKRFKRLKNVLDNNGINLQQDIE